MASVRGFARLFPLRGLAGVRAARSAWSLASRARQTALRTSALWARPAAAALPSALRRRTCATSAQGGEEKREFRAETRRLLDIVTNSLYTDRDVFVRELVSNASDALEKLRLQRLTGASATETPLQIRVTCDSDARQLIIEDSGVGMTKSELEENLGTIARSGTRNFVADGKNEELIGKFGVGFYSVFMVADEVEVVSRAAGEQEAHRWRSSGDGSYTIAPADAPAALDTSGTRIVLHLRDDAVEFADAERVREIITQHSSFVSYPILVNSEAVPTVGALWTRSQNSISDEEHREFYKFISHSLDDPLFKVHFVADAPIDIRSLLYVPSTHLEKYGLGRMEPGVSLYSRKVLISHKEKQIVPDFLRFVRGVVDSPDLPLSISRESMQDSALLSKLRSVITKKVLRHLDEQSRKDAEKYAQFYAEFGTFLKEGVCTEPALKQDLAKLVRFDSSRGDMVSLAEYTSRMPEDQSDIFFLIAPSRSAAMASPYFESFKEKDVEVLFGYQPIDDMCMKQLGEYDGKKLVSCESASVSSSSEDSADLSPALASFFRNHLPDNVTQVRASTRLVSSPAVITGHESASMRRLAQFVSVQRGGDGAMPLSQHKLEVNPNHPIVKTLEQAIETEPKAAELVVKQLYDNALIAAGLLDDPRSMLPRIDDLLQLALRAERGTQSGESAPTSQ